MEVIQFPNQAEPVPEDTFEPHPNSTLEIAFQVHDMIFRGLSMEELRDHPDVLGPLVAASLARECGPNWSCWAMQQFEHVYGVDPYTFIERVTSYRA